MLSRMVTVSALAVMSVIDIWSSTRRESASVGGRQKVCFDDFRLFWSSSSKDSFLPLSSTAACRCSAEEELPPNVSVVDWMLFCLLLSDCLAPSHGHFFTLFFEPFGRPLIRRILATAELTAGDNVLVNGSQALRSNETFCESGGRPRRRLCFRFSILSIVRIRFGRHLIFIGVTVIFVEDWDSESRSVADCSFLLVSCSSDDERWSSESFLDAAEDPSLSLPVSLSSSPSDPVSLPSFTCCWTCQTTPIPCSGALNYMDCGCLEC